MHLMQSKHSRGRCFIFNKQLTHKVRRGHKDLRNLPETPEGRSQWHPKPREGLAGLSGRYHKLTINNVFQNSHAKKKKKKAALAFSVFEVPDFTWLTGLLLESYLVWGIKILSNRLKLLLAVLYQEAHG